MPGVKDLVCNEVERVSPYSPFQSLTPSMGNSSNNWCKKEHYSLQLPLQINCRYVLLRYDSI